MRRELPGLPTPHPLLPTLPGLYQGDSFTERFVGALDEVLAPVVSTLDNMPSYLDVATTPDDLLPWLAYWIGMPVDAHLSAVRQREVLHAASRLHGWQGTRRGVELAVEAVFGYRTEVRETGGASWSLDPDAPRPGVPQEALVVQVFVPAGATVDERRLEALVTSLKPAHVVHRVEVLPEP
ncbi:phage tail protein [Nocardioides caldifontis]|uniref:phage tail protein n=1 Tax=Nocardioides caldifontis TaxID=2588938 RepID=UPI0011DF7D89|nr:phage tail protein [Nocardioides caldifontis]